MTQTTQTKTKTSEYEAARGRLVRKRKFKGDVVAYVVINAFLAGIWAATGFGYFWPGWVLAGWTEEDIQHELHRTR
jgi:fatty acid desaturase